VLCGIIHAQAQPSSSTVAALSNDCEYAADLARAGRFVEAANQVAAILTNPAHHAALRAPWCEAGEPWLLFWSNCRLYWLQQYDPGDASVADQAWCLIQEHTAAAAGNAWPAYHWLYDRLNDYYRRTRSADGLRSALVHRFLAAPSNPYYLMCVLRALPLIDSPALTNYVARYTAAGGRPFPELLLLRAQAARNAGGDAFASALAVLGFAPQINFQELRSALALARAGINNDAGRMLQYQAALCAAFLTYDTDGAQVECAALLLAELQPLEREPAIANDAKARALALRVTQRAAATPAFAQAQACLVQLVRLEAVMADTTQTPADLLAFTNLLCLPSVPDMLYRYARPLIDEEHYARALPFFALLVSPQNPDAFSRGNAYYFLAHIQDVWQANPVAALTNYLRVQQFPACLVFTAGAYYHAACLFERLRLPLHALALLCIDVPTIDFEGMCQVRRVRAMDLCRGRGDHTNAVRHAQALCLTVPAASNFVAGCCADYPEARQLWDAVAADYAPGCETSDALAAALMATNSTPDDALFFEAVTHDWPAISELPAVTATNRLLNNNIFCPRR